MSTEDSAGWVPVKLDGVTVGRASIEYGVATVQLRPETEGLFRRGVLGGFSIAPEAAGGPSSPDGCNGCNGSAGCSADVHIEGCFSGDWGRNSFTFRAETALIEAMGWPESMRERNLKAIREEYERGLLGPAAVEGFHLEPAGAGQVSSGAFRDLVGPDFSTVPADVEGVEVLAVMCEATGHEEVPAVDVGEFRRPWGFGARAERVAYCGPCSRIAQDSGRFTPDTEVGK